MEINKMYEELTEKLGLNEAQKGELGRYLVEHIGETIEDDFELKYRYINKENK